ncbi:hypothetical protein [Flavobacterium wongokense]|uniref:hypothetical protein n=1 Tax=Flavobacterium wongokense TaxID=2910674 RepID=UPI001F246C3D|nr:hypothetical protein [Flavobacterium sp. WG47]MCF6132530.1 hypothetical protein [Flavobacterium sp. WG47]
MKKTASICLFIFLFSLVVGSCDRPNCTNTNPVFDKFTPDSKEYKEELARQLKSVDPSELTYWMKDYTEQNDKKYLYVNVQGDGLCAVLFLNIRDSEKGISKLISKKGVSYHGAEFKDLKFDAVKENGETQFIFKSISWIVD